MKDTKKLILICCLCFPFQLWAQTNPKSVTALENQLGEHSFFSKHLTGFMLYDLEEQQTVYEKNSDLYFAPASTTKLFTFYAALLTLGDTTKRLRYLPKGKDIIIWGTGDPSWKYKPVPDIDMKGFLANYDKVYFSDSNWEDTPYGYGWQWDDYYYAYAAERSPLPIYGNLATVTNLQRSPHLAPPLFANALTITTKAIKDVERDFRSNRFYYNPSTYVIRGRDTKIPFATSTETFALLASKELDKEVIPSKDPLPEKHLVLKGIPLDSIYREMLHESDNFLAEHLLLMVADELHSKLNAEEAIEFITKNYLADLKDEPIWLDGSGLSRYNLFTPRSMVSIAEKIYQIVPDTTLFRLLTQGGRTGTLKNAYRAPTPYIFAKTGTISNNHSLVGYIKTKKGKLYAFAFMNNNYPYKARQVINEMEKVLLYVRDNF